MRKVSANLLRLLTLAVLARQLSAEAFGIVAIANIALQFIILFNNQAGPTAYIIYDRSEHWRRTATSVFWLNCLILTVQVSIGVLVIPIASGFFARPDLPWVMYAMLGIFAVRQLSSASDAILKHEMRFSDIAIRDSILDVVSSVTGICLALSGFGVWSLILPSVVSDALRLIATLYLTEWKPELRLYIEQWKPIWNFSYPLMGTNLLQLFLRDGDTLVIGKVLGMASLGVYNLAWQLSNVVGRNVTAVVTDVAVASLSRVREKPEQLVSQYLRVTKILSSTVAPLMCGLFVLAPEVVLVIYGPKWIGIVSLLRILCIGALVRTVTAPIGAMINATGKTRVGFWICLSSLPFYGLAIGIGIQFGLTGVACGVTIARTLIAIASTIVVNRLAHVPQKRVLFAFLRPMVASLVMSVSVFGGTFFCSELGIHPIARLIIGIIAGVVVFVSYLRWLDRPLYFDIADFVGSISPRLGRIVGSTSVGPSAG